MDLGNVVLCTVDILLGCNAVGYSASSIQRRICEFVAVVVEGDFNSIGDCKAKVCLIILDILCLILSVNQHSSVLFTAVIADIRIKATAGNCTLNRNGAFCSRQINTTKAAVGNVQLNIALRAVGFQLNVANRNTAVITID